MHHGTCSDFNQYCPNARLPRSPMGRPQFYYHQLPSANPQSSVWETNNNQSPRKNGNRSSRRPQSHQKQQLNESPTCSSSYQQSRLLSADQCPPSVIPRHHHHNHHQLLSKQFKQNPNRNNLNNNNSDSSRPNACCSTTSTPVATSNEDKASILQQDYHEHIYQYFYHHQQFLGRVSASSSPPPAAPPSLPPASIGNALPGNYYHVHLLLIPLQLHLCLEKLISKPLQPFRRLIAKKSKLRSNYNEFVPLSPLSSIAASQHNEPERRGLALAQLLIVAEIAVEPGKVEGVQ